MTAKQRNTPKSNESSPSSDSKNNSITLAFTGLEGWLQKRTIWILSILILGWTITRISLFNDVVNQPIHVLYLWENSDNRFFDDWAKRIASGDILGKEPYHPYHSWHQEFAEYYFQKHPEKEQQLLAAHPNHDSTFIAGKELWNEWYGGNTFHQEPLYPYLLALLYTLTGDGEYWMLFLQCVLGIFSGILLWKLTKTHFGDTIALFTGILYLLCGIILFQDTVLLRTSWTVFFTLLNIWTFDRAFEKRNWQSFLIAGISLGFGFLMQSTISLFFIGILIVYSVLERKNLSVLIRNILAAIIGFTLIFSPVMIRNYLVGAPLTSSSSVGAITFLASNVVNTKTINSWFPEKEKCAEIMGRNNGKFFPVMMDALATHPSLFSYLSNLWEKAKSICIGVEFSSNENYYFYKLYVPVLNYTLIKFSLLFAFGIAGLFFALYERKKFWGFYISILLQFAILIGFYVSGRLRTPFAALLLPFVVYGVFQCFSVLKDRKTGLIKIAITILFAYFLFYKNISLRTNLRAADYITLYDKYYLPKIEELDAKKDWSNLSKLHLEFMKRYEPEFVKALKTNTLLRYNSDVGLVHYMAKHYQIQSQVYELTNEIQFADRCKKRAAELTEIENKSASVAK